MQQRVDTLPSFFCSAEFASAWLKGYPTQPTVAIKVRGSGPERTIFAVSEREPLGLRSILLAPFGAYGSPGWRGEVEPAMVQGIIDQVKGLETMSFRWNVRFDQQPLANVIAPHLEPAGRPTTHVLWLHGDREAHFAEYNSMIRNHVRRARKSGAVVRFTRDPKDVVGYYDVHVELAKQKGGYEVIYPLPYLQAMAELDNVHLMVAEFEGRIISGAYFIEDGNSLLYWHGATDRAFSKHYPACLVFDEAIAWACENGFASFNFGGSAGIATLEQFKSFWGATIQENWVFRWKNPLWEKVRRFKTAVGAILG